MCKKIKDANTFYLKKITLFTYVHKLKILIQIVFMSKTNILLSFL